MADGKAFSRWNLPPRTTKSRHSFSRPGVMRGHHRCRSWHHDRLRVWSWDGVENLESALLHSASIFTHALMGLCKVGGVCDRLVKLHDGFRLIYTRFAPNGDRVGQDQAGFTQRHANTIWLQRSTLALWYGRMYCMRICCASWKDLHCIFTAIFSMTSSFYW